MNVGNLEQVFGFVSYFVDGVGLVWLEFIIVNYIKVYFFVLMKFDELEDFLVKVEIVELIKFYVGDCFWFFVDKLAYGIVMIVVVFYFKFVVVWMLDFKFNEYVNFLGGCQFELKEENFMIGWWGVFCYYDFNY